MLTRGGTARRGSPIKKWPGDRQSKSCGSVDNAANGRELNTTSIRHRTVDISSKEKVWEPITRTRSLFADRTAASQSPPPEMRSARRIEIPRAWMRLWRYYVHWRLTVYQLAQLLRGPDEIHPAIGKHVGRELASGYEPIKGCQKRFCRQVSHQL